MKKALTIITYYLLGLIAILCLSVFPKYALSDSLESQGYFQILASFITEEFINPDAWVYSLNGINSKPIMEILWPAFIYSMEILIGALVVGFILAIILSIFTFFLPKFILQPVKRFLDLMESIPDLIIATLLQAFVVFIYKSTGVELFEVASYSDQAYLAPIITLAILPAVSLFKIMLLMMEEEYLKVYVTFARSKGVHTLAILLKHILRNIIPISFHHMKIIIWGALSSQFIIERLFNVHGITYFLVESFTPITIAVSLLLIFTPFFVFFQLIEWVMKEEEGVVKDVKRVNGKERWSKKNMLASLRIVSINLVETFRNISWRRFSVLKPIFNIVKTFFLHMKNWKFALGSIFFFGVIGYSLVYSFVTDSHVDQMRLFYADDGVTLISAMPFAPTEPFFFGSDKLGYSLFDQLVVGAKYTLFFALLIAFLRVIGGLLFGILYSFYLDRGIQKWIAKLADSIHFMPLSLVAYILLTPILLPSMEGYTNSFTERVLLETVILTILVLPLTTVLIGKEMNHVLESEFITSAKVLGGNKLTLFTRHVLPHIGARLTILFGQQFIHILLIFMHLGLFNYFFGGTKVSHDPMFPDPPMSSTYEWSGLIGQVGRTTLSSGQYWYFYILAAFMITIFAMQLIIQGVKEIQQVKVGVTYKLPRLRKNKKLNNPQKEDYQMSKESFKQTRSEWDGDQGITP